MTMRICVTGGAGMIGSRLVRAFCEEGHEVVVVDNLWRGRLSYIDAIGGFHIATDFHNIDLAEAGSARQFTDIVRACDAVVHLADIVAGIGYVFNNQYEVFRVNNLINTNVFRAIAEAGVKRALYAGTACSFPKRLQLSLDSVLVEDQIFPAEPESAYGWSKLMGSLELQFMAEHRPMLTSTLILHNVYGRNCDIDPKTSQVIPSIIRRMLELEQGATLSVWGSGNQGRAFVHVDDIADAFVAAMSRDVLPPFIQIGPGHCTSIKELVETLSDRIVKKDIRIHFDTTKPEGDIGRCANYAVAKSVLGWFPKVGLEDGLRDTYRWISDELERYK